jgi:hypothetical protein
MLINMNMQKSVSPKVNMLSQYLYYKSWLPF